MAALWPRQAESARAVAIALRRATPGAECGRALALIQKQPFTLFTLFENRHPEPVERELLLGLLAAPCTHRSLLPLPRQAGGVSGVVGLHGPQQSDDLLLRCPGLARWCGKSGGGELHAL